MPVVAPDAVNGKLPHRSARKDRPCARKMQRERECERQCAQRRKARGALPLYKKYLH